MRKKTKAKNGIALFILMTSIILIALTMKELLQLSSAQTDRVRNQYDRIQAIYLARSTLALSRFFLLFDQMINDQYKDNASDTPTDLWASPVPFPVPIEMIHGLAEELAGKEPSAKKDKSALEKSQDEDMMKRCKEFFDDFPGDSVSQTHDLNARLDLNDLDNKNVLDTFIELLTPNAGFVQQLNARGIHPDSLARQTRDYFDRNDVEDESNTLESAPYSASRLDYTAKNRAFTNINELKMIPAMDDELFEYLSPFVNAVYIANRKKPAKINLNTVKKQVFQALIKKLPNAEEIANNFVKDRIENKTVYTDKGAADYLKKTFDLDSDKFQLALVGGTSDAFEIETEATVNDVHIKLETIVPRLGSKSAEPFTQMRVIP